MARATHGNVGVAAAGNFTVKNNECTCTSVMYLDFADLFAFGFSGHTKGWAWPSAANVVTLMR